MKTSHFSGSRHRPGHYRLLVILTVLALIGAWLAGAPEWRIHQAEASPAPISAEALDAMIAQLKAQQDQMAANQTKIETQTAAIKEELRQARIYVGRGGGANRR